LKNLEEQLGRVIVDWRGCQKCPALVSYRNKQVWGRVVGKPSQGGLMLIGEAPGAKEDKSGESFIGKSGEKLDRWIGRARIKDLFITNTVCCKPPRNRNPKYTELKNCWPRLQEMILILRPKVIITCGAVASNWILDTNKTMKGMIQSVYRWRLGDELKAKVVPIYHPSFLIRKRSPQLEDKMVKRLFCARGLSK
jgi:DNA polymerase